MASVVFPRAGLKVFLTASAEVRAKRRYEQLIGRGMTASMTDLVQDLRERDARDAARAVAPLQQQPDAVLLDTTSVGIEDAVAFVLDLVRGRTLVNLFKDSELSPQAPQVPPWAR
jgi:3-phosphoshikimate 1-carboxyvinyltransferase